MEVHAEASCPTSDSLHRSLTTSAVTPANAQIEEFYFSAGYVLYPASYAVRDQSKTISG